MKLLDWGVFFALFYLFRYFHSWKRCSDLLLISVPDSKLKRYLDKGASRLNRADSFSLPAAAVILQVKRPATLL